LADFVTTRLAASYDPRATYINLLTASEPGARNSVEGPLPLSLDSERRAAEVALFSALAGAQPQVCRIRSTARLDELWVSPALLAEVAGNERLELVAPPAPIAFDIDDNFPR
jgi:hypothetical protein